MLLDLSTVDGVTLESGRGGMDVVKARTEAAEADIYVFGAHVTHWQPAGQSPVLFVSDRAVFDGKKAIRGGVPVCFPWFADHKPSPESPAHGFARTAQWSLADAKREGDDAVISLVLVSTEATRELWPHDFVMTYTIRVGRSLTMTATVTNVGMEPMDYELALHTYFNVADLATTTVVGFDGGRYIDKPSGGKELEQTGEPAIEGEIDRIYQDHDREVVIDDGTRRIIVGKHGSRSTVLWNPHVEKAAAMGDFGDDEWKRMLCVETAAIGEHKVHLPPGQSHALEQTVAVSDGGR